jgi:hypothetical protein
LTSKEKILPEIYFVMKSPNERKKKEEKREKKRYQFKEQKKNKRRIKEE